MTALSRPAFAFASPGEAVQAMLERLAPVSTERINLHSAAGRILAEPLVADRPSPAADVSAMDGYAVRLADLAAGTLPVAGEIRIGQEPPALHPGTALRIVTGAPVPASADAVIRREDVEEAPDASWGRIRISPARSMLLSQGANIRRRGENAPQGAGILEPGVEINPATSAALSAFGCAAPLVHRRVRIAILTTGDEVLPASASPTPWQLRDSNGPSLLALLARQPWAEALPLAHTIDDADQIAATISSLLEQADALLMTGGVSMGTRDFIPATLARLGARTLFHGLPQRPGRPALGALSTKGQPILGLPGNPVSVLVTARRLALSILRRLAGIAHAEPPARLVEIAGPLPSPIGLWWHHPATLIGDGRAELLALKGSGDVAAVARSHGFVELPPKAMGEQAHLFYGWNGC
jgi:molybdopterin molybdotransferase